MKAINKATETDHIPQIHYDFCQWEEVFTTWRENVKLGYDMQLVLSTNPYTSGYWIEYKGADVTKGDKVYTGKAVFALEKRLISAHGKAKKNECGIKGLIL
jgi:hypothetical protein